MTALKQVESLHTRRIPNDGVPFTEVPTTVYCLSRHWNLEDWPSSDAKIPQRFGESFYFRHRAERRRAHLNLRVRSSVQKVPGLTNFLKDDRNKTTLLFFHIVSLYFNTLFNWYINLTINGTIHPSQHFPFGAAFVCQAGNFWTLLRTFCPFAWRQK